jgi:menaquinone-dependent protoporphyrinogen IX oxidase
MKSSNSITAIMASLSSTPLHNQIIAFVVKISDELREIDSTFFVITACIYRKPKKKKKKLKDSLNLLVKLVNLN